MRIELITEGGIKLLMNDEREWELFDQLMIDVAGRGEGWLAKRLGVLMDDDEWDELIAPGLTAQFEGDLVCVRESVQTAFSEWKEQKTSEKIELKTERHPELSLLDEEGQEFGGVLITPKTSNAWYSVLNQARLFLEGKWKIANLKEDEELWDSDNFDDERASAFYRDQLYCRLQGYLLSYVLEL